KVSGAEFTIDVDSVDVVLPDNKLNSLREPSSDGSQTEDFFAVEWHPQATFKALRIEEHTGEQHSHVVTGALTLRGKTHEVSFPAFIEQKAEELVAKATVVIDRTLWNIRYGSSTFFDRLGNVIMSDEAILDLCVVACRED